MNKKTYTQWLLTAAVMLLGFSFTACEDEPDKYETTKGSPRVDYVRLPSSADSVITERAMQNTVCLVGSNLRSIVALYFNDQKAVLNTSYITDNTLLVDIPNNIPGLVTDKIYMVNAVGDTTTYDFHVVVPGPTVAAMSNEYAAPGEEVTISGDYFIDDPLRPLSIWFNDSTLQATDIKKITKGAVTFTVPEGAKSGRVYVKTVYGTTPSRFVYRDTRNILFDFDGSHGGLATGHGWRNGVIRQGGIDGSYLYFGGDMGGKPGATWNEDGFSINYWPEPGAGFPELSARKDFAKMLDTLDIGQMQLKFEVRVPAASPWSSSALQVIFTGNSHVTYATASNGYYTNTALPRALWIPWQATGAYTTGDGWMTVSIPLSAFSKTHEGQPAGATITKQMLTGLSLFVWNGGVEGTDCKPEIYIDNIRVVPMQ